MARSSPTSWGAPSSRASSGPATQTRQFSMRTDSRLTGYQARAIMLAAICSAAIAVACGKDEHSLPGRADTTAATSPRVSLPSGELAYVTNEDSQELTVIATANDSVVASIPVGTR